MTLKTKKNVVYYGEYSLDLWIKMMLSGKISLPPYQRYYVWKEEQAVQLLDALKNDRFIPPVTIAEFEENVDGKLVKRNYIIDGQQRLTTIFLMYLGMFLIPERFKDVEVGFVNEEGADVDVPETNVKEWKYTSLLDGVPATRKAIREKWLNHGFKDFPATIDEELFTSRFLGFSFLIPTGEERRERYYAKIFKELNFSGTRLTERESREALYYLDSSFKDFLDPDFVKHIIVKKVAGKKVERLDFVRYLSLLANYISCGRDIKKMSIEYGGSNCAKFYEDYICSLSEGEEDSRFGKFSTMFPEGCYKARLDTLRRICEQSMSNTEFASIIDLDIYVFGMVYWVLYEGRSIKVGGLSALGLKLNKAIEDCKKNPRHTKSPASPKYVRERIEVSLRTFREFVGD